jgi:hypothetical protein
MTTQHSMAATQHKNNMVATQHGSCTKQGKTLWGTDNSTKGLKGSDNNTSHKAATTVSNSVHD